MGHLLDPVVELRTRDEPVRLAFWWLLSKGTVTQSWFLYGNVMPGRGQLGSRWWPRDVADRSFISGRMRIVRRALTIPANQAIALIESLAAGRTLSIACQEAGVDIIDMDPDLPVMGPDWNRSLPAYHRCAPSQSFLPVFARGRASPSNAAGCYCSAYRGPTPFAFLKSLDAADEVLQWAAEVMEIETGVGFSVEAGEAFRSVEIFLFPSLTPTERSEVDIKYRKLDSSESDVSLLIDSISPQSEYALHVRTEATNDIYSDQLFFWSGTDAVPSFTIPEPCDGIQLTIWTRVGAAPWTLWHEAEHHFMRAVGTQLNITGLSGSLGSPWLNALESTKAGARAKALKRISQVSSVHPMEISTRTECEHRVMVSRESVRRVHPVRSHARFFAKGWMGSERMKLLEYG